MVEDWRFEHSPHVEEGGLRAYVGVPLRFETDFGEHVAFGTLCVASNSPQALLDTSQQRSLVRLADWIVSDIVQSGRARRQRERRRMMERLVEIEKRFREEATDIEEYVQEVLRDVYPTASVGIFTTTTGEIVLEGGTVFQTVNFDQGLWEDTEYFDQLIKEQNHLDLVASRVVRIISCQCASQQTPTFLLVGSKDFRDVYDDIDSWFVTMCSNILCRYWQSRALKDALDAKEIFLRGITHQLRTPIHGILGTVELLTEELKSRNMVPQHAPLSPGITSDFETFNLHPYIATIRTSAKELISTVNSLIKLNQWAIIAQAERTMALRKIGDIENALLEECLAALPEDVSLRPSIVLSHNFPPFLDTLAIDLRLLIDCIQPLVASAIQNTAAGVITVTLSFIIDSCRLVVDIEDNGCGIVPQDHESIFAGYKQVGSQAIDTRLGLALAGKSAQLMNGRIFLVSSALGKGSHFRAAFDEVSCASSFPPRQLIKQKLTRLPPAYHKVSPASTIPSLCHSFGSFLASHGFSASEQRDGSLLILNYTQQPCQLYHYIQQVSSDQVAICLVPESETCVVDFPDSHIKRENNIVYVKAPLLSKTFEAALEVADEVMAELASPSVLENSEHSVLNGEGPDVIQTVENIPAVSSNMETQRRASTFPLRMQTEFFPTFERLCISTSSPEPPSNTQIHPVKPMTLLVDDNTVNLRLLEMYCKRRSIPYQAAKDGEKAVNLFSDHGITGIEASDPLPPQNPTTFSQTPFDLILMDLQMPVCDGITATRRIRALEREKGWKRSIIFIVTGQDSQSDHANADAAGADGYLVKPVGPKALDRWIKQWFPDGVGG